MGQHRYLTKPIDSSSVFSRIYRRMSRPVIDELLVQIIDNRQTDQKVLPQSLAYEVLGAFSYYFFLGLDPNFASCLDPKRQSLTDSERALLSRVVAEVSPLTVASALTEPTTLERLEQGDLGILASGMEILEEVQWLTWKTVADGFQECLLALVKRANPDLFWGIPTADAALEKIDVALTGGSSLLSRDFTDADVQDSDSRSTLYKLIDLVPMIAGAVDLQLLLQARYGVPVDLQSEYLEILQRIRQKHYDDLATRNEVIRYLLFGGMFVGGSIAFMCTKWFLPLILFVYDSTTMIGAGVQNLVDAVGAMPKLFETVYYHPAAMRLLDVDQELVGSREENIEQARSNFNATLSWLGADLFLLLPLAVATEVRLARRLTRANGKDDILAWLVRSGRVEEAADLERSLARMDSLYNPDYVRAIVSYCADMQHRRNEASAVLKLIRALTTYAAVYDR